MSTVQAITSRDNPLLQRLRKLTQEPTAYRKLGQVWLEGEHLASALRTRDRPAAQAVITEAGWQQAHLRELAQWAPKVAVISEALFKGISTLESPAALGLLIDAPAAPPLQAGVGTVVLDRLQDAGNVGSILRSAAAFGFGQVVAMKGTAGLWSSKVLRAGMGAHFALHLVEGQGLEDLAGLGVPLLATSSHGGAELPDADLPWPAAWVLGHEGQGVHEALLAGCGQRVRIPQPGGEESLNVAAAAAVCLYESARRRHRR